MLMICGGGKGLTVFVGLMLLLAVTATNAEALCVSRFDAQLFRHPTDDEPLKAIIINTPLKKLGSYKDWFRVHDVAKRRYWIRKKDVTNKYYCATVKVRKANLRTGPGQNFGRVYSYSLGLFTSFKVLGKRGDWVRVDEPFVKSAWVHKQLIWIQ